MNLAGACLGLHDTEGGRADEKGALENPIEMLVDHRDVLIRAVHPAGEALGRGVYRTLPKVTVSCG